MADILNLFIKGLSLGCLYALSALGFVIIFKTSGITNLAHGQLMAMGAFIFILLSSLSGIAVTAVFFLTIFLSLIIIFIIERLFILPLYAMDMKHRIFMTLAIMLMLKGLISFLSPYAYDHEFIPNGVGIYPTQTVILTSGIVAVFILVWFLRRSSLGLYLRAVSDNKRAAFSLGIPISKIFTLSSLIGITAAIISGILMTIESGLNPAQLEQMEAKIFPTLILGGFGSMRGAVLGGILMGILETFAGGRESGPLNDLLPYLILLMILLTRPKGLFPDRIDTNGING